MYKINKKKKISSERQVGARSQGTKLSQMEFGLIYGPRQHESQYKTWRCPFIDQTDHHQSERQIISRPRQAEIPQIPFAPAPRANLYRLGPNGIACVAKI